MDFLKSAVASAISKGPAFAYSFGDRVDIDESIWTLYNGTKRVWPRLACCWETTTDLTCRKTARSAAYSHSTSPRTSHACPSLEMRFASYEPCATQAS